MQQYMTHPDHGRMPIYSESEIEYNAKNGWLLEKEDIEPTPAIPAIEKNQSKSQKIKQDTVVGEL